MNWMQLITAMDAVKTGDNTPIALYAVLGGVAAVLIILCLVLKKKK